MSEQQITVSEGGPYLVKGVPLVTKSPIVADDGVPVAWRTGPAIDADDRFALCRCGGSSNKPFCDGTHARREWDHAEGAPDGTYAERATGYGGDGIEVLDDRPICAHAGFCGNKVTNVWKMADKTGDSRIRAEAIGMIERCPSGALTYTVDAEPVEPDLPTEIAVIPDGPLWVTGGVRVTRPDGTALEPRNRVTLCRCGQSGSKPLCDGTHQDVGFTG